MDTKSVIVDALATYRLTKLVIDDEITREAREKAYELAAKLPQPLADKASYLLGCPWCVSIWAGATVFAIRRFDPDLADYLNGLLAASAATGLIYERIG